MDRYIKKELQGKVKLVRNRKREGLIRGRMIGASHAAGKSYILCSVPYKLSISLSIQFPFLIFNLCVLVSYILDAI